MKRTTMLCAALLLALPGVVHAQQNRPVSDAPAWISLIDDGNGLANFEQVGMADWAAVGDAIQATTGGGEPAYLVSRDAYRNFILRVQFWASEDADSGIFLRCAEPANIGSVNCYQVNIFDKSPDPANGTGSIVYVAKVVPMPKAGGQWNEFEITAKGTRLTVMLNGRKTVDISDRRLAQGPIALQWAGGTIRFRKVQIKRL